MKNTIYTTFTLLSLTGVLNATLVLGLNDDIEAGFEGAAVGASGTSSGGGGAVTGSANTTWTSTTYHSGGSGASPLGDYSTGTSDIKYALDTRALGDWSFECISVDFGAETNAGGDAVTTLVNGHHAVSAADFSLDNSSLNGGSNYYEWGIIVLESVNANGDIISLGAANAANISSYLGSTTNYDSNSDTEIGTALGANAANDSFNMFANTGDVSDDTFATNGATGNNGTENNNTTWDNNDFGLDADLAITGFKFYYGVGISNTASQRSGPGGSLGDLTFDTISETPVAAPEPSSALLLGSALLIGATRRTRR